MTKLLIILISISCTSSQSVSKQSKLNTTSLDTKEQIKENKSNLPSIKNCVCAQLWLPVCGENGKTYSNACFAECAGVKHHQGTCKEIIKD